MFYNFKSVFIAYLTLAVVPSKRLTNTNSVKVLIPYVGPKFVPALHTVGIQKCISVIFFFFFFSMSALSPFALLRLQGALLLFLQCNGSWLLRQNLGLTAA